MKKLFIISSMLLSYVVAKADLLYVEPFVAETNVKYNSKEKKAITIALENEQSYTAFQFDLFLPKGMSISKTNAGKYSRFEQKDRLPSYIDFNDDDEEITVFSGDVEITPKTTTAGEEYYLVTYSNKDLEVISGTSGAILSICYETVDFAAGIHNIQIKNVVLAIDGYHDVKPADATSHVYVTPFDLSFREGYGTFVAPFDVTLPEGVKAFADGEVVEDIYKLGEPMTTILANTPVFVKGKSATTVHFEEAPEIKFEQASATNGSMIGAVVAPVEAPTNSYVLQKHEGDKDVKLYRVSKETPIALTIDKCCLSLPESLNALAALRFWDEENGITQIESEGTSSSMTYDLMGRPAQTGFLIKDNKKYIVK